MFPVLFHFELFGHVIQIPGYGLMVATGFVCAVVVSFRLGTRQSLPSGGMLDLWFWIVVGALVGSRALYVVLNWQQFAGRYWSVFFFWEGGLVFYGGLIGALVGAAAVVRIGDLPGWRTADIVAPAVALGHAFGRMGCFAAGCCFGQRTGGNWGARFSGWSIAYQELARTGKLDPLSASTTDPLHPTQLYEALGEVVIFFLLLKVMTKKRFDGMVFVTYLAAYALLRFTTELFRGDPTRGYLVKVHWPWLNRFLSLPATAHPLLSTSQALSLVAIAVAAGLWYWLGRARHQGCGGPK